MKKIFLIFLLGIVSCSEMVAKQTLTQRQEKIKYELLGSPWFKSDLENLKEVSHSRIRQVKTTLKTKTKNKKKGYYENMFNSIVNY